MKAAKQRGFTLIELMITVAILAILVAIVVSGASQCSCISEVANGSTSKGISFFGIGKEEL